MKKLVRLFLYVWLGAGGVEKDEGGTGGGGQPEVFGWLRDLPDDGESCLTVPLCLAGCRWCWERWRRSRGRRTTSPPPWGSSSGTPSPTLYRLLKQLMGRCHETNKLLFKIKNRSTSYTVGLNIRTVSNLVSMYCLLVEHVKGKHLTNENTTPPPPTSFWSYDF